MSLFSFSCCSEIPLPPSVQGPAAHIRRFQDFGLALYLGHKTVFLLAFTTMSIFFTAIVTQEAVELHTWLDPAYAWVYISKAMAVLSGVCRPTLYVIDKDHAPEGGQAFCNSIHCCVVCNSIHCCVVCHSGCSICRGAISHMCSVFASPEWTLR